MWRTRGPALLALPALALAACVGDGQGQVSGTLFIRGCAGQGSTDATGMSSIPPFQLDPQFFSVEPIGRFPFEGPGPDQDPRPINRLIIRLQRTSQHYPETDVATFYADDVAGLQPKVGQALPITPPPLGDPNTPYVPLPVDDMPRIDASLRLDGTCPYELVTPALRGSITFSVLGFHPGESVAATFSFTVEDLRGERDGLAPADRAVAGALSGSFDVPIKLGGSVDLP